MSDAKRLRRLEWGFRLLLLALLALWVIAPPHASAPSASRSIAMEKAR